MISFASSGSLSAGYHHDREETTLFSALVERAEIPGDRGPLVVLVADHRESARLLDELESCADDPQQAAQVGPEARAPSVGARGQGRECHSARGETAVGPQSASARLEGRQPTAEEEAARRLGEELTVRFPPLDDPDAIRGDGCVACSAFAVTCGGIEKEWWNDWETEYHKSLDE